MQTFVKPLRDKIHEKMAASNSALWVNSNKDWKDNLAAIFEANSRTHPEALSYIYFTRARENS